MKHNSVSVRDTFLSSPTCFSLSCLDFSGTMSNTTEKKLQIENEHFSLFGHDFLHRVALETLCNDLHFFTKSQHKKRSRAANYEISLQAVKNLLIFAPFSRPTSSFVGDCHKSEINANSCQR